MKETLKDLSSGLGNERSASLNRELTKKYEEIIRGHISDMQVWSEDAQIRGEFCLIIEGSGEVEQSEELWWASLSVIEHIEHYMVKEDMSNKSAIKQVAVDRNMPKREVYQTYHVN